MSNTTTTASRWLARAAGFAATGGALAILCSDALRTGHWELEHALMPIVVAITIASGHLIGSALREWRLISAAGFAVLFALGTFATVYNSVGRQAATADTAALTVEDHNAQRDETETDLATAKQRLADADRMVAIETGKGGCGRNCKDWQQRAAEVRSHVALLETKLGKIGPRQVAAPKADRAARVAALIGFERERTKEVFHLIEPFLYALLFELAAIVAFGFGFAHRPSRMPVAMANDNVRPPSVARTATSAPTPPPTNGGHSAPIPVMPEACVPHDHPVIVALRRTKRPLSNDELATEMGVTKGEASKRWREVSGQLTVTREGRELRIALAA